LEQLGAEVIELPTIRIEPIEDPTALQQAIGELASFDWIIFTSTNAVDAFFGALEKAGLDARALGANRICVIGPATAKRLREFGIKPDAQPEKYTTVNIVETLTAQQQLAGKAVLCPRADIAPKNLPQALADARATVKDIAAYRTVPDNTNAEKVLDLLEKGQIDWVTLTSSSTVKNFFSAVKPETLGTKIRIASIGPATSATIKKFGCAPAVQAEQHTINGLIEAIISQESLAKV
jgi:uroporphyrinogen III methyltransferase/synthase